MKRRQTGFAHLALLILLVVVAVVAYAGYKVVKNHQKQTVANKTSTAVIESAGTIKSAADLNSATTTLDSQNVDSDLNPDQLNNDVNSLL